MDFTLSAEQLLIKDSVTRFCAEYRRGGDAWPTFAQLGWLGIGAPEAVDGFGGPFESMILMEAFGRGRVVEPYVAQVVFAGTILREAGRLDLLRCLVAGEERFTVAYEEPQARYDPSCVATSATKDGEGYLIAGTKIRVLAACSAGQAIVSARHNDAVTLFAVPLDAPNVLRTAFAAEDEHDVAHLRFEGVRVAAHARIGPSGAGLALLERGLDHALGALCAEAVGLMGSMHEMTLEYIKLRTQFGVPIGSFQALQHRMAEVFMEVELARSMALRAAMTLANEPAAHARARAASAAKYQIARSGRFVGQNAIQLHGAIGMTQEYKVGHYFKRMTAIERILGDADYHLARYGALAALPEPA